MNERRNKGKVTKEKLDWTREFDRIVGVHWRRISVLTFHWRVSVTPAIIGEV